MIGIDLGTTNSLIAHWNGSQAVLIPNSIGELLTPSAVSISESNTVLIGRSAWERRLTHPQATAVAFKREIGSNKKFRLGNREFLPEELSSLVLQSLKVDAENFLGVAVTEAVISVPAYFNDTQRKATKTAAELAGLRVIRLINEPTAAALAYGLLNNGSECSFLVFDLGGGTFDVSVVDLFEGIIEIKASTGDNYLGGEDFTNILANLIAKKTNLSIGAENPILQARIKGLAERIKVELSLKAEVNAKLNLQQSDLTGSNESAEQQIEFVISEQEFDTACEGLLERLRTPIERAVRDSRLNPNSLTDVVLVGGATRSSSVRKLVTRLFGRFPNVSVHPDHAIALGAATQAALAANDKALNEVLLTDVCPYSLGVGISESATGQELIDGIFSPIIERNVIVPASRVKTYCTTADNQSTVKFDVFQGERRFVADNVFLGTITVPVPKMRAGEASIDVRFTYDVSGLLEVDVTVLNDGSSMSLTLLGNSSSMTDQEIAERKKNLATLKIHPREDLPNKALLARIERLYAEFTGDKREAIGQALTQFLSVLRTQDTLQIQHHRQRLEVWTSDIEKSM
jgi:molecular chaperone HscC